MKQKMKDEERIGALKDFWREMHRPPTYSEMMKVLGYRSKNSVFGFLKKLEDLGYVSKDATGHVSFLPKLTGCVRVLGSIVAGFPEPEEQQDLDAVTLDTYLVKNPEQTYMLTVRGDSMKDAGILQGDFVLVERGATPRPWDIVVAKVDDQWTLKYYVKDRVGVRLEPANPKYKFIRPQYSLEIGGVVRAVVRKYGP